jgi:hypothetical protein
MKLFVRGKPVSTFTVKPAYILYDAGTRLPTATQPAWTADDSDTYAHYTLLSQRPLSRALQHVSKLLRVGVKWKPPTKRQESSEGLVI